MNIAILGFGTVGSGVYELIKKQNNLSVTKVFDREGKFSDWDKATSDFNEIIHDSSIECIVETLGGLQPAYDYICESLKNKKHVVSANKAVIAKHLPEFLSLAKENQVAFLFDASVAGGIPWLSNLALMKKTNEITQIQGIFNGTSNYILDCISRFQEDFDTVLSKAQQLGYAEANPSADIDGYDVQNKVVLSNAVAFDAFTPIDTIITFPLRGISKIDIDYAHSKECKIRYIGQTTLEKNTYESTVFPTLISNQSLEANTLKNNNLAFLQGSEVGTLAFFGQGAGKLPTANAIVQDILSIEDNRASQLSIKRTLTAQSFLTHTYLIRLEKECANENFVKVENYQNLNYHYTKKCTIPELVKLLAELPDNAFVIQMKERGE